MRLLGHPLHPLMVHFPVAFWASSTVCDGLALAGVDSAWGIAWMLLAAGVVSAVPAMIAGLVDFVRLEDVAVPTANRHMTVMGMAWGIYFAALMTRLDNWTPLPGPELLPAALSAAGFCLMALGGWYGGELVYRYGAGMRPGRDAPK